VPTNKEQIEDITRRLEGTESALGLRPKDKSWLAKRWDWIVNHKATSLFLAIFLCFISVVGGGKYKYHLDHQYDETDERIDKRVGIRFDLAFPPVTSKLTDLGERMAKVEGKLDVLLARASVADSAQYVKRGQFALAAKAADEARHALHEATISKIPAPPEFFKQVSDTIDSVNPRQPELSARFNQLRNSLATYRSALNPVPSMPTRSAELPTTTLPFAVALALARYPLLTSVKIPAETVITEGYGAAFDCTALKPGEDVFVPATRSLDTNPTIMRGFTVLGATQTLDYITWEDITFVNTHTKYLNGPVRLHNVRFVNCTFDFPNSVLGQEISKYAALEPKQDLRVG
jgi:hypothetical protein